MVICSQDRTAIGTQFMITKISMKVLNCFKKGKEILGLPKALTFQTIENINSKFSNFINQIQKKITQKNFSDRYNFTKDKSIAKLSSSWQVNLN